MALIDLLTWLGLLTFAAMGALAAVEKRFDLLGVMVLAGVTAVGGGSIRDIVVGQFPPAVFRHEPQLWGILAVALVVFWGHRPFRRLDQPMYWLDTLGLALFAALGAERGLAAGLGFWGTVFAGAVSGVGGGVLRDLLSGQVPAILYNNRDLYATAAAAGAALVYVLVKHAALGADHAVAAGAALAVVIRLSGRWLGLALPRPPAPPQKPDATPPA
jgi:uncharacterized membrane protein YeiH